MPPVLREFTQQPSDSRRLGLPPIGFRLRAPERVTIAPASGVAGAPVLCTEVGPDERVIGEVEVAVFGAGLIIDRDGVLERIATEAADDVVSGGGQVTGVMPVQLDSGVSGYRAEVELGAAAALPYQWIYALASRDLAVCGGVLVTIRSALPAWPAGDVVLDSLRVLTRDGAQNDQALALPVVGRR
jgi:hypothetical protein